ncbi:uncharacterized protein LOC105781472 [Gossypium raimondii]|uniref:uncharacterized protein LOC105781472 n=1 Tax=Gossypium raimondii TaxID=29730 RepID=UPI00063B072D|nr:uncharacterized protein LOC105781472 [Gossypium raimondii]
MLAKQFTDEEILEAFNQMNPRKAPGIDGLLDGNKGNFCLNDTIIVLIPKIKDPIYMTNFRPISLCKVICKIISKALANRLKAALPLCIIQNQSAFVLGRMIHDNILIAHELMHYLQSAKNGPNKDFVIKLDMSKAYDRVQWNFLEKFMKNLGFEDAWVDKIMRCVWSVKYVVKCNTILSEVIAPEREEMQSKIYRVWWTCKDKGRGWAMLAWDKVCFPKGMGGLGFRDLRLFNLALTIKDTLCYHVLSSKYFPGGGLIHPKKVDKPFYTRTSIATAAKALENGFGWQVGDRNNIDICKENWGFEGLNGDSLCCTILNFHKRKVHDLWVNNRTSWNKNRVHEIYGCIMRDRICNLPILSNGPNDSMVWSITLMASTSLSQPIRGFFLSRQVFAWHMGHELLPTNAKISSIRQNFRRDCPRCGASVETLIHALKDCPIARAIITLGGLDGRLLNKDYSCCIDWIEDAMRLLDKKAIVDFITTLWNSWNNRNNYVFCGKKEEAQWDSEDELYAIVSKDKNRFGVIVRNSDPFVIGGGYGFKDEKMMANWAELYAVEESLKIARSLNIANAIFETDCTSLTNRIKKRMEDITIIGHCINESFKTTEMLNNVVVNWVNRSSNKVANFM